jgi:Rrf2 family protein
MNAMSDVLNISDAAALALHAMAFLAGQPERRLATADIASELHVSETHLSKVLQRLAKAGLVKSVRGPRGGFMLARSADEIRLLDAYEAIEGPLADTRCILGLPTCGATRCILGDLVTSVNARVRDYLTKTKLSGVGDVFAHN